MKRYHILRRESDGLYVTILENAYKGGVILIHAERKTKDHEKGRFRDCVTIG